MIGCWAEGTEIKRFYVNKKIFLDFLKLHLFRQGNKYSMAVYCSLLYHLNPRNITLYNFEASHY